MADRIVVVAGAQHALLEDHLQLCLIRGRIDHEELLLGDREVLARLGEIGLDVDQLSLAPVMRITSEEHVRSLAARERNVPARAQLLSGAYFPDVDRKATLTPRAHGARPDALEVDASDAGVGGIVIGRGDRVLVTGAAGFIGSAVTRVLERRGAHVVAMLEPGARVANLEGLDVERVVADVRDRTAVAEAVRGSRIVFHLAARYRFWPADRRGFYAVNVLGTRNVLDAAEAAGCERIVYTSTVGALGLESTTRGGLADEESAPRIDELIGLYEQSKYAAEHEALRAAARGVPVVLVLPTTPFGPGDEGPSPTGRVVLDFLNGRMVGWVNTALNVVDVDDVALGQVLAAERGRTGRSYILGGENLELRRILSLLAERTGLRAPKLAVPRRVVLAASLLSEVLEGRLLHRAPTVPVDGARMAMTRMVFSDERARRELGYRSRPAADALERSARWFLENGYVTARRRGLIAFAGEHPTGRGPSLSGNATP